MVNIAIFNLFFLQLDCALNQLFWNGNKITNSKKFGA